MLRLNKVLGQLGGESPVCSWSADGQSVTMRVSQGKQESYARIYLYGAHVTEWAETGQHPFIFTSEKAVLDGSKPIRGGIPIIFPQFGGNGPLQSHGFARRMSWSVCTISSSPASAKGTSTTVVFKLSSNAETKKVWNHDFVALYTVKLTYAKSSYLETSLAVTNTGAAPFSFSSCLHTYYAASQPDLTVDSLKGLDYYNFVAKKEGEKHPNALTFAPAPFETMFKKANDTLTMTDRKHQRVITVNKVGFPDVMVWNPGPAGAKKMGDMQDDEWKSFMCVEPVAHKGAKIPSGHDAGITLQPKQTWVGGVVHTCSSIR